MSSRQANHRLNSLQTLQRIQTVSNHDVQRYMDKVARRENGEPLSRSLSRFHHHWTEAYEGIVNGLGVARSVKCLLFLSSHSELGSDRCSLNSQFRRTRAIKETIPQT
ncbi:hypothetical protein FRC18_000355 [Serendipita sp. 400]|nr:hypothetical protein FRC18_000355 [Serendipita sp. 400]